MHARCCAMDKINNHPLMTGILSGVRETLFRDIDAAIQNRKFNDHELSHISHLKILTEQSYNSIQACLNGENVFLYDDDIEAPKEEVLIWVYSMILTHTTELYSRCLSTNDYITGSAEDVLRRFATSGGKRSGIIRSNKAEESWRKAALELAKKSRQVNKNGSLDFIASYIADNWRHKNKLVGHKRLTQVISIWIKEGKLPAKDS